MKVIGLQPLKFTQNDIHVTFIERFVHFCLKSHEPMSLFLTVGRHD